MSMYDYLLAILMVKNCEQINILGVLETGFWSLILGACLLKYIKFCHYAL
jgi:hypothetical protein